MATTATPVTLTIEQATDVLYALLRYVADWYDEMEGRTGLTNNDIEGLAHRADTLSVVAHALAGPVLRDEVTTWSAAEKSAS